VPIQANAALALAIGHMTARTPCWQDDMTEQNHHSLTPADEADFIAQIIGARQKRETLFGGSLFGDPAWDMMLELFSAELEGRKLATSELGFESHVPSTTSLRWVEKLEAHGWLRRIPDPLDLRRIFVELSPRGSETMHVWLREWLEQRSKTVGHDRVMDLLSRIRGDVS
jgi:DNA-binding MarR family transcriptional regulator